FTKSEARSWWASHVKDFVTNGVDGIWIDLNEPRVSETTMPDSIIHRGDPEYGGKQDHSHYHNVYGMLMARSTYEGMKLANDKKRPFILTRAGFVGSQRYAATWTGANRSNWEHLRKAEGFLYEDAGDGYEYLNGEYLLTTYVAKLQSSVVTIEVSKTEGSWERPKRRLNVILLICTGSVLDAWGIDGEIVQIKFPTLGGAA
ncbi:heteroglycan glucosidase 1, partial [Olea europaea subsp. europaea]